MAAKEDLTVVSDPSAAERTDLLVKSVLEAVDQRLTALRDEVAWITTQYAQHQRDLARLANELGRWLTAKAKEEAATTKRLDELQACVTRLSHLAQDRIKS